jgi:two-component system response regulator DesR
LVAESVALIRTGLLTLLTERLNSEIVAELDRGELIVSAALDSHPDVAVIDEKIAGDEFRLVRELRGAVPDCGALIMAYTHSVRRLREAAAAGADGFVGKESASDKITDAIRLVASGGKALDPDLAFCALNSAVSPLTEREIDVLRLAAGGAPDLEIASELYLSVGTVRNYISRAIGKTGARTRVDAIRKAEVAGWF